MDHVRKYQNEKPVESDLFNGQGHKQVADAISKVLLHDNTQHIIGVEGSLGAGKSTVINILKQQVQDKGFHIVTFDADQHHTSMRPALIKVIETELSSMLGGRKAKGQEKLSKAVDTALGKRLTYTKDTNSHLPFSSIIFFFLFGISAWQVKPSISFLLDLNENISTKNQDPNQSISLDTASSGFDISNGFLSLALVAFPFVLFWLIKCFKKTTQLGDLIKRNSVDTITETIDINREVGSIELKEAFDSFAELIPENNVLLLVIDNIDRVAPDDARELWSDIETLISLGSEKLRILLPYSEEHLAKALEKSSIDEGQSGKEFISKRIPVPFSAPPIVTSGWHEQFNEYWGQTLPDIEGKDGVKALIDIWDRKITPRYLKSIINRIGAKIDSCPEHNDILNGVCCAAYIIVVKDHNLTINELLSKPDELTLPNFDDKSHDGLKRQLKAAQKVLRKHVGEKEKWSKQIAALHFQTSFAVAQSELISEPIKSAFLSLDSERLIELHPLYGFDLFFKKQIEDTHAIDLIKIAASLAGNEIGKAVLDAHLNDINHEIKEVIVDDYEMDSDLVESHEILADHEVKIDLTLVKKLQNHVTKDITEQWKSLKRMDADKEPHSIDSDEWQDLKRSLEECYRYSFRTKITPEFIQKPKVDFLVNALFPFEAHLIDWDIPKLIKKTDTLELIKSACKRQALFNEEETIFPELLKKLRVGQVGGITQSKLLSEVDMASKPPEHLLEVLPFSADWQSTNKKNIAQQLANKLRGLDGSDDMLDAYTALVATAIVNAFDPTENIILFNERGQSQSYGNTSSWLASKLKERPDCGNYLTDYFSTCDFSNILKWCKHDGTTEYFVSSLEALVQARRVHAMNISSLIETDYSFLKENFKEMTAGDILQWMDSWSIRIDKNKLPSCNSEFIDDVLKYQPAGILKKFLEFLDDSELTTDDWTKRIEENHHYIRKISEYLKDSGQKLKHQDELLGALKMLPEQENSYNIELVLNLSALIDNEKLTSFKRNLSITFLKTQTSYGQRYRSILYFGQLFNMPKIQDELIASDIITFLEDAIANDKLKELDWLLSQKIKGSGWNIESWSPDNLQGLHDVLKDSEYTESELATSVKELTYKKKKDDTFDK